jgi:serine/threonine protein kinase
LGDCRAIISEKVIIMIKCENCGKENPEGYDYCDNCSQPLVSTSFPLEVDEKGNDFFNLPEGYIFAERYKIESRIGKTGGLGATYKALDKETNSTVVCKLFRRRVLSSEKTFKKLEALFEKLKELNHPTLANVLDCGVYSQNYYSVFEYIEGEDLGGYLKRRNAPLGNKELLSIFMQLAEVLEFVHGHNLVHGGLNPFNIIYDEKNGKVGITDFGIQRILTGDDRSLLKDDGALKMSLFYTPPEFLKCEEPAKASDFYSLGAVMYQLACNFLPFKSHSSYRLVSYIMTENPEKPSLLNPDLPLYISEPIMKLLEKSPKDRFASAAQLLETLKTESRKVNKGNFLWIAAIILESALIAYIFYLLLK